MNNITHFLMVIFAIFLWGVAAFGMMVAIVGLKKAHKKFDTIGWWIFAAFFILVGFLPYIVATNVVLSPGQKILLIEDGIARTLNKRLEKLPFDPFVLIFNWSEKDQIIIVKEKNDSYWSMEEEGSAIYTTFVIDLSDAKPDILYTYYGIKSPFDLDKVISGNIRNSIDNNPGISCLAVVEDQVKKFNSYGIKLKGVANCFR